MAETSQTGFKCSFCDRTFATSSNLARHRKNVHNLIINSEKFQCILCGDNQRDNSSYILRLKESHQCSISSTEEIFESFEGR